GRRHRRRGAAGRVAVGEVLGRGTGMNRTMVRNAFFLALALPVAAAAHHGWSEYDSGKPLKLTGKIVKSGYEHPHGHVVLEVPGKTWHVVLAPPSRMERRGLAQEMLKAG